MNIFDLDHTNKTIKTSAIRRTLADRYNRKDVHTHLWKELRIAAGIPTQPHFCTRHQGWLLLCAGMGYFETGQILSGVQLNRFANACLEQWDCTDILNAQLPTQTHYTAAEVIEVIERETGRSPHPSTLRRWSKKFRDCPQYRKYGTYTAAQLNKFISVARRSCAARVA